MGRTRQKGPQTQLRRAVGTNLRRARLLTGVTQEQLSEASGVDRTYIGAIERGEANWSCDVLASIAAALKVEPCVLLMGPDEAGKHLAETLFTAPDAPRGSRVRISR